MNDSAVDPLVHDWTAQGPHRFLSPGPVAVQDETLREGLQSPTVSDPPLDVKLRLLHLMDELRIDSASVGLPAAGPRQRDDVEALCREAFDRGLRIRPNCGGRTLVADVVPIVELSARIGRPIETCLFVGSSPLRQYVEEWDLARLVRLTREAVGFAVSEGLEVMYITEDTTRSSPEHLRELLVAALDAGARRLCLCDTVGCALPEGTRNLVTWVKELLADRGCDAGIDWHGHSDRGLGLANALAALQAGATRLHATALGLGERVGNTSTEQLLVNLRLLGLRDDDLTRLPDYVAAVAAATGVAIPPNAPVVGRDAFRTATGVHAAAVLKARDKGRDALADKVYSAVPAAWVGRSQEIDLGPLSGTANARACLLALGLEDGEDLVRELLAHAKRAQRVLTREEIRDFARSHGERAGAGERR